MLTACSIQEDWMVGVKKTGPILIPCFPSRFDTLKVTNPEFGTHFEKVTIGGLSQQLFEFWRLFLVYVMFT